MYACKYRILSQYTLYTLYSVPWSHQDTRTFTTSCIKDRMCTDSQERGSSTQSTQARKSSHTLDHCTAHSNRLLSRCLWLKIESRRNHAVCFQLHIRGGASVHSHGTSGLAQNAWADGLQDWWRYLLSWWLNIEHVRYKPCTLPRISGGEGPRKLGCSSTLLLCVRASEFDPRKITFRCRPQSVPTRIDH